MTGLLRDLKKAHCDFILADHKNHELLKKENFDLGIAEIFESCGFGVLEILGIKKYIVTHSASMVPIINSYLGIPQSPSSVPSLFSHGTEKMTFLQRIFNFIATQAEQYFMHQKMIDGPQQAISNVIPGFDLVVSLSDYFMLFIISFSAKD